MNRDKPDISNESLQEDASQAKPYQVRQVAILIRRYALQLEDDA